MFYNYIVEVTNFFLEMAPFLLFGFIIAGFLHVFIPQNRLKKALGEGNRFQSFNGALIGVPLPLCSCGVIPAAVSIHKQGGSKGASISFLISTPQTGIDSIFVIYSLLGLPMAIIKAVIAFVTGVIGGFFVNLFDKKSENNRGENVVKKGDKRVIDIFKYGLGTLLKDIYKWLIIGILLAALISVAIPDNFFINYIDNSFLGMLTILVVSIPLYICATSSAPIAAALMLKGLSPGAAIVLLMAGPATNIATIAVIQKEFGKKTTLIYLLSIIGGALLFGLGVDIFLPKEWFKIVVDGSNGHILPHWIHISSAILLSILMMKEIIRSIVYKFKGKKNSCDLEITMDKKTLKVGGMSCNHCKMSIERSLNQIEFIKDVFVDLNRGEVIVYGENIDIDIVKKVIKDNNFEILN